MVYLLRSNVATRALGVWTIDVLDHAASPKFLAAIDSAQEEVQSTTHPEAPAVPDAHVKLKKAAE